MRTWPVLLALLAVGCTQDADDSSGQPRTTATTSISTPTATATSPSTSTAAPSPTAGPTTTPAAPTAGTTTEPADARWVFFTDDQQRYVSPWFEGKHRVMIPFGCTPAPYYDPDPSCPEGQGFHHGIDVAIPCGTELYAGLPARVLSNDALGPAYGENPVLLRVGDRDVVIGHTRRVFVDVGGSVQQTQRFALVGDSAASDGCHLHFEVRPARAGYLDAVDPLPLLDLTRSS